MLRGDWLKSEKGVSEAISDSMFAGEHSMWVVSPFRMSSSTHAISKYTCSIAPISSVFPVPMCRTSRSMRAASVLR